MGALETHSDSDASRIIHLPSPLGTPASHSAGDKVRGHLKGTAQGLNLAPARIKYPGVGELYLL